MPLIPALMMATAAVLFAATARAEQSVTLYLNWKPGPEHAPIYYAPDGFAPVIDQLLNAKP